MDIMEIDGQAVQADVQPGQLAHNHTPPTLAQLQARAQQAQALAQAAMADGAAQVAAAQQAQAAAQARMAAAQAAQAAAQAELAAAQALARAKVEAANETSRAVQSKAALAQSKATAAQTRAELLAARRQYEAAQARDNAAQRQCQAAQVQAESDQAREAAAHARVQALIMQPQAQALLQDQTQQQAQQQAQPQPQALLTAIIRRAQVLLMAGGMQEPSGQINLDASTSLAIQAGMGTNPHLQPGGARIATGNGNSGARPALKRPRTDMHGEGSAATTGNHQAGGAEGPGGDVVMIKEEGDDDRQLQADLQTLAQPRALPQPHPVQGHPQPMPTIPQPRALALPWPHHAQPQAILAIAQPKAKAVPWAQPRIQPAVTMVLPVGPFLRILKWKLTENYNKLVINGLRYPFSEALLNGRSHINMLYWAEGSRFMDMHVAVGAYMVTQTSLNAPLALLGVVEGVVPVQPGPPREGCARGYSLHIRIIRRLPANHPDDLGALVGPGHLTGVGVPRKFMRRALIEFFGIAPNDANRTGPGSGTVGQGTFVIKDLLWVAPAAAAPAAAVAGAAAAVAPVAAAAVAVVPVAAAAAAVAPVAGVSAAMAPVAAPGINLVNSLSFA